MLKLFNQKTKIQIQQIKTLSIEGAAKSRAIKGEGFGERGRARLREVGIYRRGWCPFSSIFQVFLSEVCEGSAGCVFIIFSSFLGLPGGSSFVNFSEKYNFLPKSADPRFLHTVWCVGLISTVGGLPKCRKNL